MSFSIWTARWSITNVHIDAWLAISIKYGGPTSREAIIADLHGTNFEICQKYFGPTSEEDAVRIAEEKEANIENYTRHL